MDLRVAGGAHVYRGQRAGRGMRLAAKLRGHPLLVDLVRLAALLAGRVDEQHPVGGPVRPFNPPKVRQAR